MSTSAYLPLGREIVQAELDRLNAGGRSVRGVTLYVPPGIELEAAAIAAGLLAHLTTPALILAGSALTFALAVLAGLVAAIWPRRRIHPPADAAALVEQARLLAADEDERLALAAAELAEVTRVNAVKARWIRLSIGGLCAVAALTVAAALVAVLT